MFYCAGNWKLNKTPAEAAEFVAEIAKAEDTAGLILLPPALVAFEVARGSIPWGGQNCYAENSGAFTGENSPAALKAMGAGYCLVGHSERRQIFGERDELLAKKVKAVQAAGLVPILCVGETLAEREAGRTNEVIGVQTRAGLSESSGKVILAYEPVWAIGTGKVASPEQVAAAHAFLRETVGLDTPILYGGSVKPDNAKVLSCLPNVNGFLIGGASLKVADFLAIHRASRG